MRIGLGIRLNRRAGGGSGLSLSGLSLAANLFTVTASPAAAGGTAWYLVNASLTAMTGAAIKAAVQAATPEAYGSFAVSSGVNNGTMDLTAVTEGYAVLHMAVEKGGLFSVEAQYEFTYAPAPSFGIRASSIANYINVPGVYIDVPAGTVDGDTMVLFVSTRGSSAPSPNPPTGWTLVTSQNAGSGYATLFVYKRTASSEPSNYGVGTDGYTYGEASIVTFQGASSVGLASSTSGAGVTSIGAASVSAAAGSYILNASSFTGDTVTAPGSTTTLQSVTAATTGQIGMMVVSEGPVSAGATTVRNFTCSISANMAAALVEVKA